MVPLGSDPVFSFLFCYRHDVEPTSFEYSAKLTSVGVEEEYKDNTASPDRDRA